MNLLLIFGPPAVGKMTVGREIAARTSYRLFHNHHTIEPLIEIFGYGTEPFNQLNLEFRRRIIEEAAKHEVDLIFTVVLDVQDPSDVTYLEDITAPVQECGGEVWVLELAADLDTRRERNRGESRLAAKPSKRNLDWSDGNVVAMEKHQMNTGGATLTPIDSFLSNHPHLRVDTTNQSAAKTAEIAVAWLSGGADHVDPH